MTVATMEETATVTLTETAASKLAGIMTEKGLAETYGLRVFVSGGGCSGLQYGMTFDADPKPADLVLEQHGLRVIIDPPALHGRRQHRLHRQPSGRWLPHRQPERGHHLQQRRVQ
jgi:iron-sulfur cluster assembly accessory protein